MLASVTRRVRHFHERFESVSLARGLVYPWWIAMSCAALTTSAALLAVAQRGAFDSPLALAPVLVLTPYVVQFSTPRWLPWWVTLSVVAGGTWWLLSDGLEGAYDLAPAVLAFAVAGVTATDGPRVGAVAWAASVGVLAVHLPWAPALAIYALEVLIGFLVGAMLRWQMRALLAEHAARDEDRERSALAERQRIAHEIHDLVAHSLSVTMLHVTGARRVLSDPEPDVADAIAALTDAERIGREAMSEIRRTVGLLRESGPGSVHPLPGAGDLSQLIDGFAAAGVDVRSRVAGDLSTVPPAVGLGVYRIVQESLTNAVRHAPGAPVQVAVDADGAAVRVRVSNALLERRGAGAAGPGGAGLPGMRARADQLGAQLSVGAEAGAWVVALEVAR